MRKIKTIEGLTIARYSEEELSGMKRGSYFENSGKVFSVYDGDVAIKKNLALSDAEAYCVNYGVRSITRAIERLKMLAGSESLTRQARSTFEDMYQLLYSAPISTARVWAKKLSLVVAWVNQGNYAGCSDDARRILDKKRYSISN